MNLRDLHYVVSVADHLHFGRAAQACNVSQPTLSMQVKKLEDTLGVAIFERSNKQVLITKHGEHIVERARHILQDEQAIREIAKLSRDPYAGDLHLGAFPTLAPYFFPQAVPDLARNFPKLKLWLVEDKTAVLIEKLKNGSLDAALIALPVTDEALTSITLFNDPFLLAVPLSHAFAKRKHVTKEDIRQERLLLLEDGHCLRDQALEVCDLIGVAEYQDFRATSLETLRQMVASGMGITLMPRLAMREHDGIATIPFHHSRISRTIGLVFRKTSTKKLVIEAMASSMRNTATV